jgi:hypothetical protein
VHMYRWQEVPETTNERGSLTRIWKGLIKVNKSLFMFLCFICIHCSPIKKNSVYSIESSKHASQNYGLLEHDAVYFDQLVHTIVREESAASIY